MEGCSNSEARRRKQERNGEPEPRRLTETHPLYAELTPGTPISLTDQFDNDLSMGRISEINVHLTRLEQFEILRENIARERARKIRTL